MCFWFYRLERSHRPLMVLVKRRKRDIFRRQRMRCVCYLTGNFIHISM